MMRWSKQIVYIAVVITLLILFLRQRVDSSDTRESFQMRLINTPVYDRYRSILQTQTAFSVQPLTLYSDTRDANERLTCETLAQLFPLQIYDWTLKYIDQMRSPFLIVLPEYINADMQNKFKEELHFVANLYHVSITLIVDSTSPIDTWDDVRSSTIGVFEHSKCEHFIRKVFEVLESPIKIITVGSYQEMFDRWINGDFDVIFMLCSHPSIFVANMSTRRRIKILKWDIFEDVNIQHLIKFWFPGIVRTVIPLWYHECKDGAQCELKRYNVLSLDQYLKSFGFRMNVLASQDVPPESMHALARTLRNRNEQLRLDMRWMLPASKMFYCPRLLNYHPGVRKYLLAEKVLNVA